MDVWKITQIDLKREESYNFVQREKIFQYIKKFHFSRIFLEICQDFEILAIFQNFFGFQFFKHLNNFSDFQNVHNFTKN